MKNLFVRLTLALLLPLCCVPAALADEPIIVPKVWPETGPSSEGANGPRNGATQAAPAAAQGTYGSMTAWHQRYDEYFRKNWGVAIRGVRRIASGYMLEFKYEVLDAEKAGVLNEKRSKAFLIDEATDTRLAVPAMENIGELRQAPKPEEGRLYYIIFGNPGKLVPKGGKVDLIIGRFRADGLIVD